MSTTSATQHLKNTELGKPAFGKAYGFALVTGALFLFSWIGQFITQAVVESNEAQQHGSSFAWGEFWPQFLASTFENWQSEFLQLIWQAVGLAFLFFWGSSQSRETEERMEAKLDLLLQREGLNAAEVTRDLNREL